MLLPGDLSAVTTYQAGVMQSAVHRSLQKHCDDILRPYGITKAQWFLIGTVQDGGPDGVRITDLGRILDTNLPYLTNTINALVTKGMLQRVEHGSDSRSKLVSVHPEFAPKCAVIEAGLRKGLRASIYAHIDPAEFRIYMKVLYQLADVGQAG